jgi:hypothetical protein
LACTLPSPALDSTIFLRRRMVTTHCDFVHYPHLFCRVLLRYPHCSIFAQSHSSAFSDTTQHGVPSCFAHSRLAVSSYYLFRGWRRVGWVA